MRRINIFIFVVILLVIFIIYDSQNNRVLLTRHESFTQTFGRLLFKNESIEKGNTILTVDKPERRHLCAYYFGNHNHPSPILILTYMRSGSTFLGDVIQASPDVFYIFEPLWSVQFYKWPLKDLHDNDIGGTFDDIARHIIKSVFTCQIAKLPRPLFINEGFISVSRTTSIYSACRKNSTDILSCAEILQKHCLRSKNVMIKSIRLRAYEILDIKSDFPDLKVIHLIRDPRATLHSQKAYGLLNNVEESKFVSQFCRNVTYDTQAIRIFKKFYPKDVQVVYHDSFEGNPISFSRELYSTLNLPFTSVAEKRIVNLTRKASNCTRMYALCTTKFNSTVAIKLWRTEIKYPFVKLVDSLCGNVYSAHGFLPLPHPEMLKNVSVPSYNHSLAILAHEHFHLDEYS